MLSRSLLQHLHKSRFQPLLSLAKYSVSHIADLGIVNGTICNSDRKFLGDVYIKDGKIISIEDKTNELSLPSFTKPQAKRIIDADNKLIIPGGIDPHTHLQMPFMGTTSIDDFNSGTRAALSGGTTMNIDFIIPSRDESLLEAYEKWRQWADPKVNMDYALHMAIVRWDKQIHNEMEILVNKYGVTSFKIFLAYKGLFMLNDPEIIAIMSRAKELGALMMVHAENGDLISHAQEYVFNELEITGPEGHQLSRLPEFEAEATNRVITIANYINTPLYVVHVQSDGAGQMVRLARSKGYAVYGETLAATLGTDGRNLWDTDFNIAAGHVMSPPLDPDPNSSECLIKLIQSGDISTVATDNCTFSRQQKYELGCDDFRKIPNGVNGLEDRMSICWNECVINGKLSETQFVDITSCNAAKIFNLYPKKGRIDVGCDGDIVIWNGDKKRVISCKTHHHAGDFNVYEGKQVSGCADVTISNGNVVWENDELICRQGSGTFIARKPFGFPFETINKRDIQRKPKKVNRSVSGSGIKSEEKDFNEIALFNDKNNESFGLENIMETYVKQDKKSYDEVNRIVYGVRDFNDGQLRRIENYDEIITTNARKIAVDNNFKILCSKINGKYDEEMRQKRNVTIGALQNKYQIKDFQKESVVIQKEIMHKFIRNVIYSAAECGVNILCFQECWNMPFAFCTREKHWPLEFAEYIDLERNNENCSLKFVSSMAKECNMCIISPMLERDIVRDTIHNTAVIIGNNGEIIGKHRKNHIPRVGDFNESTYYMEGDTGHPVFSLSEFNDAKIAVNICYGRHHPLNWQMFGLNGAEIVFNPSATTGGLSEHLWHIEARNAAIANNYFTVAINRIGTEYFSSSFTSGDGKPSHNDFGYFYGSTYISAPDGSRTFGADRINDTLLVSNIDLNLCRQIKDQWGFQMTARYDLYAQKLKEFTDPNGYKPQIIYDKPQSHAK
eukprot:159241_1